MTPQTPEPEPGAARADLTARATAIAVPLVTKALAACTESGTAALLLTDALDVLTDPDIYPS